MVEHPNPLSSHVPAIFHTFSLKKDKELKKKKKKSIIDNSETFLFVLISSLIYYEKPISMSKIIKSLNISRKNKPF